MSIETDVKALNVLEVMVDFKMNVYLFLHHPGQVSISPTFYQKKKSFNTYFINSFFAVFMCLQFRSVNICRKEFGARSACKMLVKSATGVMQFQQHFTSSF